MGARASAIALVWFFLTVAAYASQGEDIKELISASQSNDRVTRLEGIKKLGRSKDSKAVHACVDALLSAFSSAEESEETWLHALYALHYLASSVEQMDHAVIVLEQVAEREPAVTIIDRGFDRPKKVPKYKFVNAARSAASVIRQLRSRRALRTHLAELNKEHRVTYLAKTSWEGERGRESDFIYLAAKIELIKLGVAGVQPSLESRPRASRDAQVEMVEYMFQVFAQTKDDACVTGLLELARSKHPMVWQQALLRIETFKGNARIAEEIIGRIECNDVPNKLFVYMAIETFGYLSNEHTGAFLKRCFSSQDGQIRNYGAQALSMQGDAGLSALLVGIKSPELQTRMACARGLLGLKNTTAQEALRQFLKDNADEDPEILTRIRRALDE